MKIIPMPDPTTYLPIGNKVLLILPKEDVNAMHNVGGVLVPQGLASRNSPMRKTVVTAVGPECKQVRKGDTVFWNKSNGSPFPEGDEELYFIPEEHLVAITERAGWVESSKPCACAPDEGTS